MRALFPGWMLGACAAAAMSCAAQAGTRPVRSTPAQSIDATTAHHVDTLATAPETQRSAVQPSSEAGDPTGFGMERHFTSAPADRPPTVDQPGRYSPRVVALDPDPVTTTPRSTSARPKAAAAGAGFQIPKPDAGGIRYKGPKGGDLLEPADPQPPEPIDPQRTKPSL